MTLTDTTTARVPDPPQEEPRGSSLVVLWLSLAGLAFAALQSLVAPAISIIGRDIGADTADASWVITAYLLSASILTPILGKLGDMYGKRRMLIIVLLLLIVGVVIAALAPTLAVLIVGRVFQGASGAVLPLAIGLIRDTLPKEQIPLMIGLISSVFGIGAGIGIVAAGPIVEHLSWPWLFWLPGVLVVIALGGVILGLRDQGVRQSGRLDLPGAVVLSVALAAMLLAINKGEEWGWSSLWTIGLFALAAVAVAMFVVLELQAPHPFIDMKIFVLRGVWTANGLSLVIGFVTFGIFLIIPMLLQLPEAVGYGFGKTTSASGLLLLPSVIAMIVGGGLSGVLVRRFGTRLSMFLGGLLIAVGFLVPAIDHSAVWQLVFAGCLAGLGIGVGSAGMNNAIVDAVAPEKTGETTSVNTIARTVGSSIGTAVIAAIIAANSTAQGLPEDGAFTIGFWVCTGLGVLAMVVTLAAPAGTNRQKTVATE
jgi:EmrB/QacA subfamily drug resistance transporter